MSLYSLRFREFEKEQLGGGRELLFQGFRILGLVFLNEGFRDLGLRGDGLGEGLAVREKAL